MIEDRESYVYLGRQPILDKNKKVIAYELLYRTSYEDFARIENSRSATSRVIVNIFNNIGIQNIAGNKKVFINISNEVIQSNILELIKPENIVLEILEETAVDNSIIEKLTLLKKKGYRLALDDFLPSQDNVRLLHVADYVKIDLMNTPDDLTEKIIRDIRKKFPNIYILAEKVEDYRAFQKALKLDFDLFQGFFFAKPVIITHKRFDPFETTLLEILKELNKENVDLKKVEQIMKKDVKICFNLLKFVNSAFFSFRKEIKTITHAISMIGTDQLKMWILLMLYAEAKCPIADNPLLDLALVRARMMEITAKKISIEKDFPEMAYLTGMLSLIDALLGLNKEEILKDIKLSKKIKEALIEEKNELGLLLKTAEAIETSSYEQLKYLCRKLGVSLKDVLHAESEGIKYAENIKQLMMRNMSC
ncbi:MAG TPA: HDOD domain-containing protein [Persephonella sp.]|uniref:EAL domain protein n=1 Tax=Persephonella marina (strain DSM 14350 / EX-H1) TaxID=123214 RepID=C0QRW9_PERMH|nr:MULTISPECIES: HDOD domain-containing protein [Persephonella]ACO04666.1 EAL domain protein [Persephonella marina EX-H1]HCB69160.1 HDOD domain-containing protein [Persephonella sp.]